jgi:tetratricopeptide (TPR) repeat protein
MQTTPTPGHGAVGAQQEGQRLLEAAVAAMHGGDEAASVELLRRSIEAAPVNPTAHYLLGAEYAQRKQYGDAIIHWTTAVEQAPATGIARLQLGLLWLTLANPTAALLQLEPLGQLGADDPLRHFGIGLSCLCRDDLPGAAAGLSSGLRLETANLALAADMQRVLSAVDERIRGAGASHTMTEGPLSASLGMAISAYAGYTPGGG